MTKVTEDQCTISRAQIDTLNIADARILRLVLLDAIESATGDDELANLLFPLMLIIEQSLLDRPSLDVEALATKVWVACRNVPEDEADLATLSQDIQGILGLPR